MMGITVAKSAHNARAARVVLKLYVAGVAPNSRRAEANLDAALTELGVPAAAYYFDLIDVLADARRVMTDGIIVTPTLIGSAAARRMVMIGDLSDGTKLKDMLTALLDAR
jgi:hypothetical protein